MDAELLASRVRNHEHSDFDGEDTPDAVIRAVLERELERLDAHTELEERAEEKRAELRRDLGLSGDTADGEPDDVAEMQAELRRRMGDN